MRFHTAHGRNITLSNNNTIATRCQSFANALVFTERPLDPNEVFLFEISDQQQGWAGNIKCGITFHNPAKIVIPQYLLPDLLRLGKSFVFPLKPSAEDPFSDKKQEYIEAIGKCEIQFCDDMNKDVFVKENLCNVNPCDVGSRIGIFISPCRRLYFIINGVQYGPCTKRIPSNLDVYAAADLYGNTREIRILNYHVPRLKTICTTFIHSILTEEEILRLDPSFIPRMLKTQLLSRFSSSNEKPQLAEDKLITEDKQLAEDKQIAEDINTYEDATYS